MGLPGNENIRGRVVVAEIMPGHIGVEALREVALVLFFSVSESYSP